MMRDRGYYELKKEINDLKSEMPNGDLIELKKCINTISIQQTALHEDFSDMKSHLSMMKKKLLNPENGGVVKVNKNTEFRRDLEKQREQGKGIGTVRSDLRQLLTWKSSINRAMWIAYSLLLGLMLKLLFNIGF